MTRERRNINNIVVYVVCNYLSIKKCIICSFFVVVCVSLLHSLFVVFRMLTLQGDREYDFNVLGILYVVVKERGKPHCVKQCSAVLTKRNLLVANKHFYITVLLLYYLPLFLFFFIAAWNPLRDSNYPR